MISHSTASKPGTSRGQGAERDRELVLLVEAGDLDDELHRNGPWPPVNDTRRTMHDGHTAPDGADAPRRRRLAALAGLVAAVALVAGTVGPPLVGRGVFLTGDTIFYSSPWRSIESPAALDVPDHGPTTDTVDAIYPTRVRFAEHARDGAFLGWDPLAAGGMAVGSESTSGVLGPMAWPYLLLPSWYTPAGAKVLQMAVAIGFTYLFCRRIGAGPFPALFAGLAFAGSGFLVMWTNWQQPEVAALVPALFWAAERHLQRQEVASVVPVAVVLAAMLLEGSPPWPGGRCTSWPATSSCAWSWPTTTPARAPGGRRGRRSGRRRGRAAGRRDAAALRRPPG